MEVVGVPFICYGLEEVSICTGVIVSLIVNLCGLIYALFTCCDSIRATTTILWSWVVYLPEACWEVELMMGELGEE